jgi:glycosyltransferase involved in cell wall biosynthesis
MNQIYVILGGLFWRAWGKRVGLWYNHPNGGVSQWLGFLLAHRVFHTSPFAFSANRKKSHRMPAGIDTNLFKKTDTAASRRDALSVGRIDASKNLDVLVDALLILHERGTPATATIIGVPPDPAYLSALKERARPLGEHIVFAGPIPNERLSEQFSAHTCSVNLAASGHYDKTVLESCACETPVLVSSRAFSGFLPETLTFSERDAHSLADRLSAVLSWSPAMIEDTGRALRQHVVEHESLSKLVESVLISLRQHDRV